MADGIGKKTALGNTGIGARLMADLQNSSDRQLDREFDRLGDLKADCIRSMEQIRKERDRRKDERIAHLDALLKVRG